MTLSRRASASPRLMMPPSVTSHTSPPLGANTSGFSSAKRCARSRACSRASSSRLNEYAITRHPAMETVVACVTALTAAALGAFAAAGGVAALVAGVAGRCSGSLCINPYSVKTVTRTTAIAAATT